MFCTLQHNQRAHNMCSVPNSLVVKAELLQSIVSLDTIDAWHMIYNSQPH